MLAGEVEQMIEICYQAVGFPLSYYPQKEAPRRTDQVSIEGIPRYGRPLCFKPPKFKGIIEHFTTPSVQGHALVRGIFTI